MKVGPQLASLDSELNDWLREITVADRLVSDEPIFRAAAIWHCRGMKTHPNEESEAITLVDIRLVQESFRRIEQVHGAAAERFFRELFSYDESMRAIFPIDRWSREDELMNVVRGISAGLTRPADFSRAIDSLAKRCAAGVLSNYLHLYVGAAWFSMLEVVLCPKFNRRVHAAWFKIFGRVVAEIRVAVSSEMPVTSESIGPVAFAHASAA